MTAITRTGSIATAARRLFADGKPSATRSMGKNR